MITRFNNNYQWYHHKHAHRGFGLPRLQYQFHRCCVIIVQSLLLRNPYQERSIGETIDRKS